MRKSLPVWIARDSPEIGIVSITDGFGPTNPSHLGADLLASHLDAVGIEPDILEGDAAQPNWYPITDETKALAEAWRQKLINMPWMRTQIGSKKWSKRHKLNTE